MPGRHTIRIRNNHGYQNHVEKILFILYRVYGKVKNIHHSNQKSIANMELAQYATVKSTSLRVANEMGEGMLKFLNRLIKILTSFMRRDFVTK